MKKILITRKLIKDSEDKASKTFDPIFNSNDELYSQSKVIEMSKGCDGILSSLTDKMDQETINKLEEDNQAYEVANKELQLKYREAEKYGDELSKKLREHDLTRLTLRKPGLIEKRVNDATKKVFEELESSTAVQPDN